MATDYVLALDLGTTSARALLIADDGSIPARDSTPLRAFFPEPGWLEQDPQEMWDACLRVLRGALTRAGVGASQVVAIGVVTQRATVIAWDAETGHPLAPAIGWQDQRVGGRVAELRAAGIPINTLASATKLEWWLQNDPGIRKAGNEGRLRLGTPDTWITYRLTGGEAIVTDPGHASCTALYDAAAGEFSPGLCGLFGVPVEALARVVPSSAVVGETPAALLGSPIPVAARAGDQQAAAFAQGVHRSGDAKLTLGTSAMLDVHTGTEPGPMGPGVYPLVLWRLADGSEAFCLEGTVITAGSAVEWLVGLGMFQDAAAVDRAAREAGGDGGVRFVPALQGLGTPFLDDAARGLVLGLTRGSGRADLARATLDGVAHRCVDVIDEIAPPDGPLRIDGGLGRSEFLVQTLADLSGREVRRAVETETTAQGAGFLAGLAVGTWRSPESCRDALPPATSYTPEIGDADRRRARTRWRQALALAGGGDPG